MSDQSRLWFWVTEALLMAALFLGAVGLYSLEWLYGLKGGVSTVGAQRVMSGDIPYRDFWTMYAPGHFYLLGLLFHIFGTHLIVEVVAASVVYAAASCICYRLVINLAEKRLAAIACASIFLAATYNTGHFKEFGTYPPAILFVFVALNLIILHYKNAQIVHVAAAGLATGAVVAVKHDVGAYTAMAIVAGLVAHHFLVQARALSRTQRFLRTLGAYSAGVAIIVVPLSIYFGILTGSAMFQDLIVFPLTDFRFARPEVYPSIFRFHIYDEWRTRMLFNVFKYLKFAVPFVLFLLALLAGALTVRRRKLEYVAPGVMFAVGFLLHYTVAHVQINTHIITMSVYAACLGVIFYDLAERQFIAQRRVLTRLLGVALAFGWILSLGGEPAYKAWDIRRRANVELRVPKVQGFKVSPEEARALAGLSVFVDTHIPPSGKLFVGLHRHDVVVIGDTLMYFILDRASATRYQEFHPAITDSARAQREIIADLQKRDISFIVLKHIFPDEHLEKVKMNLRKNLPGIGATDLDEFIRGNFVEIREFGRYAIWGRKEAMLRVGEGYATSGSVGPAMMRKGRIPRYLGRGRRGPEGNGPR